ncbi:MAG: hypothetical protein AAF487_00725 [Bacteroidota bacterium]
MYKLTRILVLHFLILIIPILGISQDTAEKNNGEKVIIEMSDGSKYIGYVQSVNDNHYVLKTKNGDLKIRREFIRSIHTINYDGKYIYANQHYTSYFFSPSSIPLEKKKSYYQNILVTLNSVNYGLSKKFSIGGGLDVLATIAARPTWFINPKVGFEVGDQLYTGASIIVAGADQNIVGISFASATYGSKESNLSLGLGYGFSDGELSNSPLFVASGTHRISNSIALMSENYFFINGFEGNNYFGVHGIRTISRNHNFDFGLIIIPSISFLIPAIPMVGYVRSF